MSSSLKSSAYAAGGVGVKKMIPAAVARCDDQDIWTKSYYFIGTLIDVIWPTSKRILNSQDERRIPIIESWDKLILMMLMYVSKNVIANEDIKLSWKKIPRDIQRFVRRFAIFEMNKSL